MTSETVVKSPKVPQQHSRRYVDIKDVPELIARVMKNDLYINDMAERVTKPQAKAIN